jgi:hypothetical protein
VFIIGGEGGGRTYNEVEAYNTVTNSWRSFAPMPTRRHGMQAAICNGGVYVADGGRRQGSGDATKNPEVFFRDAERACP